MDWMDQLTELAGKDEWYQQCLRAVEEKEAVFLAIRDALTTEQQEQLDGYIAACEELEHALVPLAYRLGGSHGA